MLSVIFSQFSFVLQVVYTVLCLSTVGEITSSGCLVACGLAKRNLSSLPSLNHLLTLCKKQKLMVSYIFGQTNQCFTLDVVLILLGNTTDERFLYIRIVMY